jgi:hypothetical protein
MARAEWVERGRLQARVKALEEFIRNLQRDIRKTADRSPDEILRAALEGIASRKVPEEVKPARMKP